MIVKENLTTWFIYRADEHYRLETLGLTYFFNFLTF